MLNFLGKLEFVCDFRFSTQKTLYNFPSAFRGVRAAADLPYESRRMTSKLSCLVEEFGLRGLFNNQINASVQLVFVPRSLSFSIVAAEEASPSQDKGIELLDLLHR